MRLQQRLPVPFALEKGEFVARPLQLSKDDLGTGSQFAAFLGAETTGKLRRLSKRGLGG